MSNSSLVTTTHINAHKNSPRNHVIDRVTIHMVVGQVTADQLGVNIFNATRQASSNYGIGTDGSIGLYVDETDRAWTSSSYENDNRAITIETASDTTPPYTVNAVATESLIKLLVDIVKRNPGLGGKLVWRNDRNNPGNMTIHQWFAATSCPGEYLLSKMGWIADEVNKRLSDNQENKPAPKPQTPKPSVITVGSTVKPKVTVDYNGTHLASFVTSKTYPVIEVKGDRVVLGGGLNTAFKMSDLELVK